MNSFFPKLVLIPLLNLTCAVAFAGPGANPDSELCRTVFQSAISAGEFAQAENVEVSDLYSESTLRRFTLEELSSRQFMTVKVNDCKEQGGAIQIEKGLSVNGARQPIKEFGFDLKVQKEDSTMLFISDNVSEQKKMGSSQPRLNAPIWIGIELSDSGLTQSSVADTAGRIFNLNPVTLSREDVATLAKFASGLESSE